MKWDYGVDDDWIEPFDGERWYIDRSEGRPYALSKPDSPYNARGKLRRYLTDAEILELRLLGQIKPRKENT